MGGNTAVAARESDSRDYASPSSFEQILSDLGGPNSLALMLYGSHARGTSDSGSDVDILRVVKRAPRPQQLGNVNVTEYLPSHLASMAREGSLFILHLAREGRVLSDQHGVLANCLRQYQAPTTYDTLKQQLCLAAGALDTSSSDFPHYVQGLARLGVYLLRTAAYVRCAEIGVGTFDLQRVTEILREEGLREALSLRRRSVLTPQDVMLLGSTLGRLIGAKPCNPYGSVEAYAVATADHPHVAALLSGVLAGNEALDYTALALPPL